MNKEMVKLFSVAVDSMQDYLYYRGWHKQGNGYYGKIDQNDYRKSITDQSLIKAFSIQAGEDFGEH